MPETWPNDVERRELRGLLERIKKGDCVLVLGPRVAVRPNDPEYIPLDELLASELILDSGAAPADVAAAGTGLRRAADLYYRAKRDRQVLEIAAQDFYAREDAATTVFHLDLAQLPFRLCISASPDSLMLNAFVQVPKKPQKGYYSFRNEATPRLSLPTESTPIVYHLFGHHDDASSMVLTEGDLIQFLVSIVRGLPPVPDHVRSILTDSDASFLFLGFGFQHWYLRVLLQVMNVYGHRSLAFEDPQFFDHPEREQTVGFFSGDRLIDFRPLRWEDFAKHLRNTYESSLKKSPLREPAVPAPSAEGQPVAFISYASEDRDAVEFLAETLATRGVRVWQDRQDLRGGDDWDRVLLDVISRKVDYVIVMQTQSMTTRIGGVYNREIEAALRRQAEMGEFDGQRLRFVIPIKTGVTQSLASLKTLHVIDIDEQGGVDSLAQSLLEDWARRAELRSRRAATV